MQPSWGQTPTINTYLSPDLKATVCLTPLTSHPTVSLSRVIQDLTIPQNIGQNTTIHHHPNSTSLPDLVRKYPPIPRRTFYNAVAKQNTVTLSADELDTFRYFLGLIDSFQHFHSFIQNKQQAQKTYANAATQFHERQTAQVDSMGCKKPKTS